MKKYKYTTKIDIGYDENGKRLRKCLRADTKADLRRKEIEFRAAQLSGIKFDDRTTFGAYAKTWLKTAKDVRSENTKAMYENIINKHLAPLATVLVSQVKPTTLQLLINDTKDQPRTCQQMRNTLRQIFRSAIRDDMIKKDPSEGLIIPKYRSKEKRQLTSYEKAHIMAAELSAKDKLYLYIAYGCGLRREEILALTRNDVDLCNNVLHVNKAVAIVHSLPVLKETKSAAGVRDVPIPDFLAKYFKQYFDTHKDIVLFLNRNSSYYGSSSYQKMWTRITKAIYAGMTDKDKLAEPQDLTSHILRHNYCTELCYAGLSIKEVARLLGHEDYKMIMEVYAHVDASKERTAEKIKAINF